MSVVVTIALPFFALIFTGMIAGRTSLVPGETILGLNRFVFYFALPALLIISISDAPIEDLGNPRLFLAWLIPSALLYLLIYVGTRFFLGGTPPVRAIRSLAATHGNVGFIGLPLVIAALGAEATPAIAIVIAIDMAFIVGVTTAIIEVTQGGSRSYFRAVRMAVESVVRNPLVIAAVVGASLSGIGVTLAAPLASYLDLLGAAAGPAALFALGATLARQAPADRVAETSIIAALKLLVHPLLVWIATVLLDLPPITQASLVIMASLPSAATVYVVAQRYQVHVATASTSILMTTVIAVATVSFILHVLLG